MSRILLGVAMTLVTVATAFPQYEPGSYDEDSRYDRYDAQVERSGYSYVRDVVGGVTVESRLNGRVTARRNMPISAGDEILVSEAGRAEIGLADGNLLFVGGGTRARFSSLYAQQGEDDDFSAIDLRDGSVILAAIGNDEGVIPRIDTEDATVYLSPGTRVRVNADPRRGTVVVVRAGSAEVRTRADTYTLEAGQYMVVEQDEDPDIARGVFSRDRFDLWAGERLDDLYSDRVQSASVEYVDDEYASEVVALDDYGDWEYSSAYSTHVWSPRVSVGWTPYSYGSWYYTPIGLTWWSYDPWGWYPFHYGSWYFDVGFHRWCWLPSYTYSPAWVYWAYTPRYVGWCPTGYYSYYSPWFDSYHRYWGWSPRYSRSASLIFAIEGSFKTRDVDFGGWNFVTAGSFGSGFDRVNVISGTRLAASLGDHIAISPKPIVVSSRGGSLVNALQDHVRQAPSRIERVKGRDADELAPVLGRQKSLRASTLDALKERTVVAGRGKLAGPGAEQIASRGAIVEKGRSISDFAARGSEKRGPEKGSVLERGRKSPILRGDADPGAVSIERKGRGSGDAPVTGRAAEEWRGGRLDKRDRPEKAQRSAPEAVEGGASSPEWRGRGLEKRGGSEASRAPEAPATEWRGRERVEKRGGDRDAPNAQRQPAPSSDEWRQRKAPKASGDGSAPAAPRGGNSGAKGKRSFASEDSWRGLTREPRVEASAPQARGNDWRGGNERARSEAPAKRVIEGAVPGRRWQDADAGKSREKAPADWRQRSLSNGRPAARPEIRESRKAVPDASRSQRFERAPEAAREYRAPKEARPEFRAPRQEYSAPREYRAPKEGRPEFRAPRQEYSAPREYRAPKEARPEFRAPRQEYSAPREYRAPRSESRPQYSAPRSQPAPQPSGGSFGKGQGKGRKG